MFAPKNLFWLPIFLNHCHYSHNKSSKLGYHCEQSIGTVPNVLKTDVKATPHVQKIVGLWNPFQTCPFPSQWSWPILRPKNKHVVPSGCGSIVGSTKRQAKWWCYSDESPNHVCLCQSCWQSQWRSVICDNVGECPGSSSSITTKEGEEDPLARPPPHHQHRQMSCISPTAYLATSLSQAPR